MLETRPFDAARYIRSREEAAMYMDMVLADGDPAEIVDAVDVVSRAMGAPEPGLSPDAGLDLIAGALHALGLRLAAVQTAGELEAVEAAA